MVRGEPISTHMFERRAIKRVDTPIPLTIKLSGTPVSPPPITVETDNISPKGLSIVIRIRTKSENGRLSIQEGGENAQKMAKYLLLDDKTLQLGINILPQGRSIRATGRVKWCYRNLVEGCYYVKAGVVIEEIEREHKKEWLEFLKVVYQFLTFLEPRAGYKGVFNLPY
jgi:hypothetical protein